MTCNEFLNNNFVEITRTKSDFTFLGEDISSENKGYGPECSDEKREREERGMETGGTGTEGWSGFLGKNKEEQKNSKGLQKCRNK